MKRYCDVCAPEVFHTIHWHACLNSRCECEYTEYHYERLHADDLHLRRPNPWTERWGPP